MEVKVTTEGKNMTAFLSGDIDHHTAKDIRNTIDESIEKEKPELLIFDFKHVDFMDSSGIGLLLGRYKLMESINGDISVINVPQYILRVIKLSGLEQLGILKQNNKRGKRA